MLLNTVNLNVPYSYKDHQIYSLRSICISKKDIHTLFQCKMFNNIMYNMKIWSDMYVEYRVAKILVR